MRARREDPVDAARRALVELCAVRRVSVMTAETQALPKRRGVHFSPTPDRSTPPWPQVTIFGTLATYSKGAGNGRQGR